ncbi:La-related protein 7 [Armadillidium vulgare]|nr:La-related protein 7 [Armadillidium vulgare]
MFIAYSARFPHSKRLEYYQSYIFISIGKKLKELGQGTLYKAFISKCYSDYNNPIPINILFPLSDKLSLLIHQFPILII